MSRRIVQILFHDEQARIIDGATGNTVETASLCLIRKGKIFRKIAKTELRKVRDNELGKELITVVKHGDILRNETSGVFISKEHIFARNNEILGYDNNGTPVTNEWVIERETAIRNYGRHAIESLSYDFTPHSKTATIQAVPLSREIMDTLGIDGEELELFVNWNKKPMTAVIGDYITSDGYSISSHNMKDYVEESK